jgi:SprT-like family
MTEQACLNDASSLIRHQWLEAATAELRLRFTSVGYTVPDAVRVSIGWTKYHPYKHAIGQCWNAKATTDQYAEIFISPELGTAEQTSKIIGVVAHELVHAVTPGAGHRKPFKLCALAVGLVGRMTATEEGPEFIGWVDNHVVPRIGKYPAGKIMLTHKPQTTRMIKCQCATCEYPVRTTKLWIEGHGTPHCPTHGAMLVCT